MCYHWNKRVTIQHRGIISPVCPWSGLEPSYNVEISSFKSLKECLFNLGPYQTAWTFAFLKSTNQRRNRNHWNDNITNKLTDKVIKNWNNEKKYSTSHLLYISVGWGSIHCFYLNIKLVIFFPLHCDAWKPVSEIYFSNFTPEMWMWSKISRWSLAPLFSPPRQMLGRMEMLPRSALCLSHTVPLFRKSLTTDTHAHLSAATGAVPSEQEGSLWSKGVQ